MRIVCPRCTTDNAADEEHCRECGLELHPDPEEKPHAAGIRRGGAPGEEPWISRYAQVFIGGVILAAVLWIPVVNSWRQRTQFETCQQNIGKLAVALQLYVRDSDNIFPLGESWTPALQRYLKDAKYLACPSRPTKQGYAYNSNLSGQKLALEPGADAIVFFEAPGDTVSMAGTDFEWIKPPVHSRGNNLALLSGTVKVLRESPDQNYWIPKGLTQPLPPVEVAPTKDESKGSGSAASPDGPGASPTGAPAAAPAGAPTNPPPPGMEPAVSTPDSSSPTNASGGAKPDGALQNPPLPPQPGATLSNPPLPPQPGATGQGAMANTAAP